jgi:hypothetical protein
MRNWKLINFLFSYFSILCISLKTPRYIFPPFYKIGPLISKCWITIQFKLINDLLFQESHLDRKRSDPFSIGHDYAHKALVVVSIVSAVVRICHSISRVVRLPLGDHGMVAEGANKRRTVLLELLGVGRRVVLQEERKKGRVPALRVAVEHPGKGEVGVQTAQKAVDGAAGSAVAAGRRFEGGRRRAGWRHLPSG